MKNVSKALVIMLAITALLTSCKKESSEKKILEFRFATPAVEAVITESAKTIVATVPVGTDVTALVPIITISEKASVNPLSGMPQNFTNPVAYTVTAEDGSQAVYTVTVTFGNGGGGGVDPNDPTTWSGNIDANTTWPDLGLPVDYIVDGYIYINGNALLTIEPGVTIMFTGVNGGIEVGENAGLKMVGTAEKPIILEGPANNPNNGSWHNVRINSQRNDNQFEYVQFLRGGSDDGQWDGVIRVANGRLGMKNCIIDGSLGRGLVTDYDESYLTAFENNTIKNCASYPWTSENLPALCKNIGNGNVFTSNGKNMIDMALFGYYLEENMTLHALGIPYRLRGGFTFDGNKTMTIEAGVKMLIPYEEGIRVYESCNFIANGTPDNPIVFNTEEDSWNGIVFESGRNNNSISYCQFKNCGNNDSWDGRSCLYIRESAKLSLVNNVFGPSNYNGVGIEYIENWGNVSHSGNTFVGCAGGNVWIEGGGVYNGVEYESGQILNDLP